MSTRAHALANRLLEVAILILAALPAGMRAEDFTGAAMAVSGPGGQAAEATIGVAPLASVPAAARMQTPAALLQEWREATEAYRRAMTKLEGGADPHAASAISRGAGPADVSLSATTGLFDRVTAELRNLDSLLAEATKWEEQMAVPAGGGRAQVILARADAFTVERQYRRRAEASAQSLARLLQQALALSARMAAVNAARLDQLQAVLTSVPAARQAAVDAPRQPDLSDFEYYEVKTITDLKRISALPEVYGDASRWEALYEANRDKIADPAAPLPTGTLLVVPVRSPESTGER